jgi:predicted nucleic acid-binding protein
MIFVLDASLAASWVVADEQNEAAEALLERVKAGSAGVPDLFWHEMRNILLKVEKQGRSAEGAAESALMTLRQLPLTVAVNRGDDVILALARTHQLTPYDAAYLDLAVNSGLPLATADRRLAAAAHSQGLPILGPYATPSP